MNCKPKARSERSERRGFSLIVVVIIVALVSVSGIVVLEIVTRDQETWQWTRERVQAREVAEGALMEVANDTATADLLPSLTDSELVKPYEPSANSAYVGDLDNVRSAQDYDATISHVRFVPVVESSISYITAMVYEVRTDARVAGGRATQEIHAEAYRVVGLPSGKVLPRMHAR
jgi:Tfp pilus assembly protein PilX